MRHVRNESLFSLSLSLSFISCSPFLKESRRSATTTTLRFATISRGYAIEIKDCETPVDGSARAVRGDRGDRRVEEGTKVRGSAVTAVR